MATAVLSQARVGPSFAAEAEVWEVMTLTPPGPPARGGRAGICPQGTLRPPSSPQLPGPEGASPLKVKAEGHPRGKDGHGNQADRASHPPQRERAVRTSQPGAPPPGPLHRASLVRGPDGTPPHTRAVAAPDLQGTECR